MAEIKSPAQEYLDLLSISRPEVRKRLDNANSLQEFADVLGIPPKDALGPFLSRSAYFANPQGPVKQEAIPSFEEIKEKNQKEHDFHSYGEADDPNDHADEGLGTENVQNQQQPAKPRSIFKRIVQKFRRKKPTAPSISPEPTPPEPNTFSNTYRPNRFYGPRRPNTFSRTGRPNAIDSMPKFPPYRDPRPRPGISRMPPGFRGKSNKMLGKAGKTLAKTALRAAMTNPYVLIAVGVIAAIAVFVVIIMLNVCQATNGWLLREFWAPDVHRYCNIELPTPPPLPPGVTIDVERPTKISNGESITYKITVTYNKSQATSPIDDMTLADLPDFDHEFVSANPAPSQTRGSSPRNNYIWELSQLTGIDSGDAITFKIELTVKPTVVNEKVQNWIYIEGVGSGDTTQGNNSPPTSNQCNGKYRDIMTAIHNDFPTIENTNFGDPTCSYSNTNLRSNIESLDPQNTDFWMDIARCESGSSPNSYGRQDPEGNNDSIQDDINQEQRDSKGLYWGTWGLFQMRRSSPLPFKQSNIDTEPDRGDVPWQRQVENAIATNKDRARNGDNFVYWESAYCLCATARHTNQPYCADIKRQGLQKSCSSCN